MINTRTALLELATQFLDEGPYYAQKFSPAEVIDAWAIYSRTRDIGPSPFGEDDDGYNPTQNRAFTERFGSYEKGGSCYATLAESFESWLVKGAQHGT